MSLVAGLPVRPPSPMRLPQVLLMPLLSTVNWSASLKPPHTLRETWAKQYGLDFFLTSRYNESVNHVNHPDSYFDFVHRLTSDTRF